MTLQLRARSYENGEPVCITVAGERIVSVEPAWPNRNIAEWPFVAPGLFDIQINGHAGTWFTNENQTAEKVLQTLEPHFRYGITRMCPTLITSSFNSLAAGFAAIREACERQTWADKMVAGCHLEGPYISREDGPRGAHPLEHVRRADWDEFCRLQEISGDRIRLITLAPECEEGLEFIEKAVKAGVVVSIGHTAATTELIRAAADAGARLSTHLGNGAHGTIRRHPNYIWDQLGEPRLMASIITDGHHLPASVVRSIVRTKGPHNTIITCDASGLAGCPPGFYKEGSIEVEVLDDGPIVLAGQRQLLAGSGQETDTCVANAAGMAGISLRESLDMAARNPARLLGVEEVRLRRGSRADLFLFRLAPGGGRFDISATIAAGEVRFGTILKT